MQDMASRTTVLVDEAYLDLWEDWPHHTATERVRAGEPVIVTRTFSKLHGLAGLRVGYALAPPELIQRLEKHRMTLLGCAGVAAATASYQDLEFQAFSRARLQEGLAITTGALRELKLRHVENGRGNFVFFDTGGPLADFSAAMRRAGYLVGRPFPPYAPGAASAWGPWSRCGASPTPCGPTSPERHLGTCLISHFGNEACPHLGYNFAAAAPGLPDNHQGS